MEIKEIYKLIENIGVFVFSTINGDEVHSRIAHFNGCDDDGIYFRTMMNKPFGKQLIETGKVTVCGITNNKCLGYEEDGTPNFPPSYTIRLIGHVKRVAPEIIKEKSKTNKAFLSAANDIDKYPAMAEGNFVLYRAKGEIFDVDFDCINRDHKLLRKRFSFGGAPFNPAGVIITDKCIECGKCKEVCTFKAIEEGSPFKIRENRCDDCGSCLLACPVNAIEESLIF
ncbi:4Fe-4S binding protein [Crassaminicella profunda]|uniref:4Fe-4S binding protein n=1 Tax=Crassaminicella profunda TaxID=1286698 RepID=UPI001FE784D4|nr:4Fe-4S binding protein [Crassaminicella profunda]